MPCGDNSLWPNTTLFNYIWPSPIWGSSKSPWRLFVKLLIWWPAAHSIILAMIHQPQFGRLPGLVVVFSQMFSLVSFVWLIFQISKWLMYGSRMLLLGICVFTVISQNLKLLRMALSQHLQSVFFVRLLILGFGQSDLLPLCWFYLLWMVWREMIFALLRMSIRLFGWIVILRKSKFSCGSSVIVVLLTAFKIVRRK